MGSPVLWGPNGNAICLETIPINGGGTGHTTAPLAFGALSPLTTKGDLLTFSTLNTNLPVGSDGQVLSANSAQSTGLQWINNPNSFIAPTYQIFTSGSGTYTTPTSPRTPLYLEVTMVGGGSGGSGGGSSSGGGGSSGGTGNTVFASSLVTAYGAVPAFWGGAASAPGSYAINSPFIQIEAFNGGWGSAGGNYLALLAGSGTGFLGSSGGNSPFGGSGGGGWSGGNGTDAAPNSGSGGGAGGCNSTASNANPGTSGSAGGYIKFMVLSPASSYSYSVGNGGTGGSDGVYGSRGGSGGSGIIIVKEYYQ